MRHVACGIYRHAHRHYLPNIGKPVGVDPSASQLVALETHTAACYTYGPTTLPDCAPTRTLSGHQLVKPP